MPQSSQYFLSVSPHQFCLFLQTEIPKVMREGMEEMLQYEKKTEEKKRVYTYEKAVER